MICASADRSVPRIRGASVGRETASRRDLSAASIAALRSLHDADGDQLWHQLSGQSRSRALQEPSVLLRSQGLSLGWEAGDDNAAGDDVRPGVIDRGANVLEMAAAVGDVQAA